MTARPGFPSTGRAREAAARRPIATSGARIGYPAGLAEGDASLRAETGQNLRLARRLARAALAGALLLVGVHVVLAPSFVRRHLSPDGLLQPYAKLWLERYRLLAIAGAAVCAGLALACRVRPRGAAGIWRASRPWRARAGLVAGGLLAGALVSEGALRLAEGAGRLTPPAPPGELTTRTRAFMRAIADQLDERGLRGEPWRADPRAASRRVLVVGDSFVFGYGVPRLADTFPARLQRALRRRLGDERLAVYNGGEGGADTPRVAHLMEELGARLRPHVVVYGYYPNDVETRATLVVFQRGSYLVPLVSDVGRRVSRLWRRAEPQLVAWLRGGYVQARYERHLRRLFAPDSTSWRRHRTDLAALVERARDLGARPVVVIFPMLEDLDEYPLADEHARVRAVFEAEGVPVLDLLEVFADEDARRLHAGPLDHHLNAEGIARAVEVVAPWLIERLGWERGRAGR